MATGHPPAFGNCTGPPVQSDWSTDGAVDLLMPPGVAFPDNDSMKG